ncbi:hypothetical protein FGB62_130g017 [Gracilaria domingensis]|nr:hypothetical protein FGB62_130g017 [Gracilaria domingensis]
MPQQSSGWRRRRTPNDFAKVHRRILTPAQRRYSEGVLMMRVHVVEWKRCARLHVPSRLRRLGMVQRDSPGQRPTASDVSFQCSMYVVLMRAQLQPAYTFVACQDGAHSESRLVSRGLRNAATSAPRVKDLPSEQNSTKTHCPTSRRMPAFESEYDFPPSLTYDRIIMGTHYARRLRVGQALHAHAQKGHCMFHARLIDAVFHKDPSY